MPELKQIDKEILVGYLLVDEALDRGYLEQSGDDTPFVTSEGRAIARECLDEGIWPRDEILAYLGYEVLKIQDANVVKLLHILRKEICEKPESDTPDVH